MHHQGALQKIEAIVSDSKPDIFRYHDYRQFLADWIEHQRHTIKGFSLRKFAQELGMASGYLPMVLSGERPLSMRAMAKLLPLLDLSKREKEFFETIHTLGTTDLQKERVAALRKMKSFKAYREKNPRENEAYEYLTHWYYPAIRELAADPAFRVDAAWIQKRLRFHVPLNEIREALEFLMGNGYIEIKADGSISPPEKSLDCIGGIYRVTLTDFHQQMLKLAQQSIEKTPSTERQILGHTFSIPSSKYRAAQAILDEALCKVQNLARETCAEATECVYHLELALFPLTQERTKK